MNERRENDILLVVFFVASILAASILAFSSETEARAAISSGQDAYVDVQAATLWSKPYQPRRYVDRSSYTNRTNLTTWERSMSQRQKGWLIGKTQTQALYGQEVRVLRTLGKWAKVAVKDQDTRKLRSGYPGWVPKRQLTTNRSAEISRGELIAQVDSKYGLLYRDRTLSRIDHSVSFGTRLPVLSRHSRKVRVVDPNGGSLWLKRSQITVYREGSIGRKARPTAGKIRRQALAFKGTAYVWAGTGSYGFDCSGLTYQVYRSFGIDIPRDAGDQRSAGDPVSWRDKRPGDLIFFGEGPGRISHVGMYIGGGRMINAPYAGRKVIVQGLRESGRMDEYQGVRRYL